MVDDMDNNIINGSQLDEEFYEQTEKTLSNYLIECLQIRRNQTLLISDESSEILQVDYLIENSYILAAYLSSLGYTKGNVIGILSENRVEIPLLMLAILNIGAIATTFSPFYTSAELENTVNISKPSLIFITSTNFDKIVQQKEKFRSIKHFVIIDEIKNDAHRNNSVLLSSVLLNKNLLPKFEPVKYSSDDPVMVLYSSGTTGLPKGVTLTSRGLIHIFQLCRDNKVPTPPDDTSVILVLPMFHGFGILIYLQCLVKEFKLVIMKQFEEKKFLSNIEKYRPTFFYLVPPILILLMKSPLTSQYDLSSMKEILVGAAPVSVNTSIAMINKFALSNILEGYGLTEGSFLCSVPTRHTIKLGSAGKLIPGIQGKIVDIETGRTLGPMKVGEFCFKGTTIMKGYYGNDKATSETIDSEGWLHTGDIGYFDKDEFLYIVDRLKELIKYKGFQVAPAELENLLLKHDQIKDAAVIGIPDELAGELPKAYIVKKPEANITAADVIQYVSVRVSTQKRLRGGVEFIDQIPRNPSGKILRKVLKSWSVKAKL